MSQRITKIVYKQEYAKPIHRRPMSTKRDILKPWRRCCTEPLPGANSVLRGSLSFSSCLLAASQTTIHWDPMGYKENKNPSRRFYGNFTGSRFTNALASNWRHLRSIHSTAQHQSICRTSGHSSLVLVWGSCDPPTTKRWSFREHTAGSAVAGPRTWSSMPATLQRSDIFYEQFRWELKTFLFNG